MPGRIIAIADVHGCLAALRRLLDAIRPQPEDTLVMLGDYVDRGPDSRGVIELVIGLRPQCGLIPLMGNHDQMLLRVCRGNEDILGDWLLFGGQATLASYHVRLPELIPPAHRDFLASCHRYYETERHFFVHANYRADLPLERQPCEVLFWESLRQRQPGPHYSGKTAIVGHTSQKTGEILDLGYLKCIDTWVYGDGWLTALDVETGQIWQTDKMGRIKG